MGVFSTKQFAQWLRRGSIAAAAVFACAPVLAQSVHNERPTLTLSALDDEPFRIVVQQPAATAGLAFDLGGSERRKLRLTLNEPLGLEIGQSWWAGDGLNALGGDSRLNWSVTDGLSLGAGLSAGITQPAFQALGSIHCEDGVLEAGSYRATDCRFVSQSDGIVSRNLSVGARYQAPQGLDASINLFRSDVDADFTAPGTPLMPGALPQIDPVTLQPTFGSPLDGLAGFGSPWLGLESELTGVDLDFQLGFTTDEAGDLRLGLQLTHVMDAQWQGSPYTTFDPLGWTLAEPYETARFSVDWAKGAFSGGIESYYRPPVQFLNRSELDSLASFDVHFTWHTPWNGSLSLGASNLLNSGAEDAAQQPAVQDPFESVYGRIPYVRYKQDL